MLEPASTLITMLYTDIEGSTQRWERFPQAMHAVLAQHDALLQTAISRHRGVIVVSTGDGVLAAFTTASDAVQAALAAQRALRAAEWGDVGTIMVRMGLHTGEAVAVEGNYHSPALNRGARLMAAGHGGQILLSAATYELIRDQLPAGTAIRDLGEHRLKDLIRPEHIFQIADIDAPQEFAPLKTLDQHRHNLPLQATALIGREQEVAQLVALLGRPEVRLVTLTGVGGVGKTRLSLQVAADLVAAYHDGAYFVELAPLHEARFVLPAIAQALGVTETGDHSLRDLVVAFLRGRQLLLVLDNFEHVLEAAPLVGELLRGAAGLKVLLSSRIVLHVYGEREYPVPPLAVPEPRNLPASLEAVSHYTAVQLFIARAQLVKPDFVVTNETAPAVAAICARLDGLPLAIELAAARSKLWPLPVLLERLERRLPVLTGGARDLPARQQTLRGAIDWSYHLLDPREQELFAWLSVFAGGWTEEAAAAVCAAGDDSSLELLDALASLVDKSLVRHDEGRPRDEPRFSLLETLREYAAERLAVGDAAGVRGRHLDWCLALAEQAAPHLNGADQGAWLSRLELEHDNLRAALRWAREMGDGAQGTRLAVALSRFWYTRGYLAEGRGWLEETWGDQEAVPARPRATALKEAGNLALHQGEYGQAAALYMEALGLFRAQADKGGMAGTLTNLGIVADRQGEYGRAAVLFEEAAALARERGDPSQIARTVGNLAAVWGQQGDYGRATALYEEVLVLFKGLEDRHGISAALDNLGQVAFWQEDYGRAVALHEESLAIARVLGNRHGIVISLINLAAVAIRQQEYERATALLQEGLQLGQEIGARDEVADSLERLAWVLVAQGHAAQAVRLGGAAEALWEALGVPLAREELADHEQAVKAMQAVLGEAAFTAAWAEGRALSLAQAITLALADQGDQR